MTRLESQQVRPTLMMEGEDQGVGQTSDLPKEVNRSGILRTFGFAMLGDKHVDTGAKAKSRAHCSHRIAMNFL